MLKSHLIKDDILTKKYEMFLKQGVQNYRNSRRRNTTESSKLPAQSILKPTAALNQPSAGNKKSEKAINTSTPNSQNQLNFTIGSLVSDLGY